MPRQRRQKRKQTEEEGDCTERYIIGIKRNQLILIKFSRQQGRIGIAGALDTRID